MKVKNLFFGYSIVRTKELNKLIMDLVSEKRQNNHLLFSLNEKKDCIEDAKREVDEIDNRLNKLWDSTCKVVRQSYEDLGNRDKKIKELSIRMRSKNLLIKRLRMRVTRLERRLIKK